MTHHAVLQQAYDVQQAQTAPKLFGLLTSVVREEDLPPYGKLAPMPDMKYFGTLKDALERVYNDPTAMGDVPYVSMMIAAALTKVCSAQQERIEALEQAILEKANE